MGRDVVPMSLQSPCASKMLRFLAGSWHESCNMTRCEVCHYHYRFAGRDQDMAYSLAALQFLCLLN